MHSVADDLEEFDDESSDYLWRSWRHSGNPDFDSA